MPDETLAPLIELFRHRFIETLVREKLLSRKKADQMLTWKHSGFSLDAGDKPVSSYNIAGRRNLAEPERSGDRLPPGSPKGERSESIHAPCPFFS